MKNLSRLYAYPLFLAGLAFIALGAFAHFVWASAFTPALVLVGIIFIVRQGVVNKVAYPLLAGFGFLSIGALFLYMDFTFFAGFFAAMGAVSLVTYRRR